MISYDGKKGNVKIDGNKAELMSEIVTLMRYLVHEKIFEEKDLDYMVYLAKKSSDELHDLAVEKLINVLENKAEILEMLLRSMKDDNSKQ